MKRFVRGHAEGKMLNEHLGGAIISLFRACGPKVLKMLMFVRVVNGNLPITVAGRAAPGAPDGTGCAGRGQSAERARADEAVILGILAY
jgi:hypothetical protein